MMDCKTGTSYRIEVENFADARLSNVKVMICQLDFDKMHHTKGVRLHFVDNDSGNRAYLRRFLNIATSQNVDLLVFPELTIPTEFVEELLEVSKQYDMYIVGGTHYKKTDKGYLSVCPIVTPHGVYNTEKITPSPFEVSSFNGGVDGAIPGNVVKVIHGSKIGDFAVTICLDYTNDLLRNALDKDSLDFLIVTAFNPQSNDFFYSMHSDVQRSPEGLYVVYSNVESESVKVKGKSALFAFMDKCYKTEFVDRGCTDLNPPNKIYEFADGKSYCIFEVDLEHKKPYNSKNGYTVTNVKVIEEDNAQMDDRYQFTKAINASDDKYLFIDKYYVKPREYDEMCALLDNENVLVITGDPGIGKTYTAIRIMQEYYEKGFRPTWFYGMAKEDRDEQKEHLLNFEPQERDIVYLEDPFGITVFENREELKTLFGNWVEKFRACKAKLIITSRAEVFKKFEQEVLTGDKLEAYQKELNVRKPSYKPEDLKKIARLYIEAYTSWSGHEELVKTVMQGIDKGQLISPLMIYNLVKNFSKPVEIQQLTEAIKVAKSDDLVTQFAEEIKILTIPAKILLYLVLLYGKKNISLIREMFVKVQTALFEKTKFEGSLFAFELKGQEDHRIQRLGERIPVYRFSHPTYEEALIGLAEKDSVCALIVETSLTAILKEDDSIATEIFRRYVTRYPKFLESIMTDVLKIDFDSFTEPAKLDLTRRMLLSKYENFEKTAREIYPIEKVVKALSEGEDGQLFILRLRTLNRRRDELDGIEIAWDRVFTKKIISGLHPSAFLMCYDLASAIDDHLMEKLEVNLQKADVIRKFILLPTEGERQKLNDILSNTVYKDLYEDLKNKIPEDILSEGVNKYRYIGVIRKYILRREPPKGEVRLDYGAMKAVEKGAKIYPIGVVAVVGEFENGDIVCLTNRETRKRILSMVEMSSNDIKKYKGYHSQEIYEIADKVFSTVISRAHFREKMYRTYRRGIRRR